MDPTKRPHHVHFTQFPGGMRNAGCSRVAVGVVAMEVGARSAYRHLGQLTLKLSSCLLTTPMRPDVDRANVVKLRVTYGGCWGFAKNYRAIKQEILQACPSGVEVDGEPTTTNTGWLEVPFVIHLWACLVVRAGVAHVVPLGTCEHRHS